MNIITNKNRNYHANPESIIQGDKYRFTVLTSQLIRLEYNENNIFEDNPTQTVLTRILVFLILKLLIRILH